MLKTIWLDNPLTTSMMFFPRRAMRGTSRLSDVQDGAIESNDGLEIGYRLYRQENASAFILCFHGNGETVADYDDMANLFRGINCALMIAEYRGYGWSQGKARGSTLLSDAEAVFKMLPTLTTEDNQTIPLYILGRSLGGAAAIHLTYRYPEEVEGLILESTFAHAPLLLNSLGLPHALLKRLPGLFGNIDKIRQTLTPLLIIHGESDNIIPIEHARMLYEASPVKQKRLLSIPKAGHNNLVFIATDRYLEAIKSFIN
jgi:alpha-beta hydrolase superfamily lysophospholipase